MLEQRVAMLADQAARLNDDGDMPSPVMRSQRGSADVDAMRDSDVPKELPPRLAVDDEDTHFISPSHWEGILSDVRLLKSGF